MGYLVPIWYPSELNATIEKSIAAARRFDAAKVRADQLAAATGAPAD